MSTLETAGALRLRTRGLVVVVSVVVGLMTVSVAGAAAAPLATTDAASAVTASDATVNGTLDANGGGTTVDCHFDWVDDATFLASGFDVPNQVGCNEGAAFDDGAQAVTGSLGGLVPNALYHVRLVVSNATETTFAAEQTFTTASAAPVLESFGTSVSSITPTGATLSSSINPNNATTTYRFEYGTTMAYGQSAPSPDASLPAAFGDQPVAATLTGLTPATTYHYRISADNGTGGAQYGVDQTFHTAPAAAPTATELTASSARLTGTIDPLGSAATYHFEYGTTTAYGTSTPEVDGGSSASEVQVSRTVTGLRPGTTYHFRVFATVNGQSVSSDDVTFTTAPAPVAITTAVTGLGTTVVTLNGSADTHGQPGSLRFTVRSSTSAYRAITPDQQLTATGTQAVTAVLADLPPGQTFHVQLSVTSNGASSAGDEVTFSTAPLPPFAPPAPPPALDLHPYGCAAPVLSAYNAHPKPGDSIAVTGSDLGTGGTIALDTTPITPIAWSSSSVMFTLPDDVMGTLPLTVNCGAVSNTVAVAIYQPPSNAFTVTAKAKGGTVTVRVRVPGPGAVRVTGGHLMAKTTRAKKAGTVTTNLALTAAARKSLARHHTLAITAKVRFTPTGGSSATKSVKTSLKTSTK